MWHLDFELAFFAFLSRKYYQHHEHKIKQSEAGISIPLFVKASNALTQISSPFEKVIIIVVVVVI